MMYGIKLMGVIARKNPTSAAGGKKVAPFHEMMVGMAEASQSKRKLRPALSLSRKKRMIKIGAIHAASGMFHLPPIKRLRTAAMTSQR